jgi:hypothetical protein
MGEHRFSRRRLLAGAGVGALAGAAGGIFMTSRGCQRQRVVRRPAPGEAAGYADYVDHDGWMLTTDDHRALQAP